MTEPRPAVPDAVLPFRPAGRIRSAVYGLLWRGCELFRRASSACGYAAAGLLRGQDLQTAMRIQFRDFGASPDEVDEGLNPVRAPRLHQWLRPSGRVLLVGCGAGRDLIGLHRLGYHVTGLEQAPDAAENARQHLERVGLTASVHAGSIESAELEHEYDAIVFASSCYSNMRGSALRIATLARLRSHMSPGRLPCHQLHRIIRVAISTRVSRSCASARGWHRRIGGRSREIRLCALLGRPAFSTSRTRFARVMWRRNARPQDSASSRKSFLPAGPTASCCRSMATSRERPLRILQVGTVEVGGGAATVASTLARGYRARGCEAWLAAGQKTSDDPNVFLVPDDDRPSVPHDRLFGSPEATAAGWRAGFPARDADGSAGRFDSPRIHARWRDDGAAGKISSFPEPTASSI